MAEIEGTVTLDSVAAEVPVLALSAEKIEGEYQILDSTVSAADGTYGLDPGSDSIVIALGGNGSAQGAVSAGAIWTPAEITVALWLDAADAGTITEVSGAVSDWADKSSNARNFTQPTAGSKPTTGVDTINGLNVLSFDADYMRSTDAASDWTFLHDSTKSAVFMVCSPGLATDPDDIYGLLGTNSGSVSYRGYYLRYDDRSASGYSDSFLHAVLNGTGGGGINTLGLADNVMPAQQPVLIGNFGDPAAAEADRTVLYVDGNLIADDTTGVSTSAVATAAPSYTLDIGSGGNGVWPWKGQIAEVIIISGAVDTTTRQLIEGYLAWKWGLEANLPSGHPYKDAAPTV